jgi:hypothetical protein
MEQIKKQKKETNVLVDVICDCCGKSCKTEYGFERMKLSTHWGFMSNKDLEKWDADLCEKCVDEKLSFIKFKKSNYIPRTGGW